MPQFFRGLWAYYSSGDIRIYNKSNAKKAISFNAWNILSEKMALSIEFYEYLRQRLQNQAKKLNIKTTETPPEAASTKSIIQLTGSGGSE